MLSIRDFQFFDPEAEVTITTGHLPHWQQPGATYFITYRTVDSIGSVAMERILCERDDWLMRNGIDVAKSNWHRQLRDLSEQHQRTFRRLFATKFEDELDRLEGECLLGKLELAEIVAASLKRFDGERYRLGAFVVMPNHVHILAQIFADRTMLQQCFSWKHYQAHKINQAMDRTGHFYQPESFDHLVRDDDHFRKFRRYIADNPSKAKLKEGEYVAFLPDIDLQDAP
jgi:putative transposase